MALGIKDGRNINARLVASVRTVSINSVTATTIAVPFERISFRSCLAPDLVDVDIIIRYYPAAQDNIKQGDVLTRYTSGNNNLFKPEHKMDVDNMYYGEISAISVNGTHDLFITEY